MEYHLKSTGFKFRLALLLPTAGQEYKEDLPTYTSAHFDKYFSSDLIPITLFHLSKEYLHAVKSL